jgi:hypothetical protein
MSVIYINEDHDKNKTTNDYKDKNVDMDNDNSNGRSICMSLIKFNINFFQQSCY